MNTPKNKGFKVKDLPTPPKSVSKSKRMIKRPKHLETYELDPPTVTPKERIELNSKLVVGSFDLDTSDSSPSPIDDGYQSPLKT